MLADRCQANLASSIKTAIVACHSLFSNQLDTTKTT